VKAVVLAVGKLKSPALESLCAEYVQRARPLLPIEVHECRDLPALRAREQRVEGPCVVLDERGELLHTRGLAKWLQGWRDTGSRNVSFLLAGADGFEDEDRARADRVLALSRLTLPHRIARLVLLEQLYRAATILAGHPYHRE
jgi:23S rRNA (pseudouridine1915-N3)-methyltransferase